MKTISLTQDKVALVDDADYASVNRYKWYAQKDGCCFYAVRNGRRLGSNRMPPIHMHRFILNAPKGTDTDHINGNRLDNRRVNLRLCSRSENCRNRRLRCDSVTGFKGVTLVRRNSQRPYQAHIRVNGKRFYLGCYRTAKDAAQAYDMAAIKHFGEFALTNEMLGCKMILGLAGTWGRRVRPWSQMAAETRARFPAAPCNKELI